MAYAFFKVPCSPESGASDLLNDFLRRHAVLSVQREWVSAGEASFWAFCIQYQEATAVSGKAGSIGQAPKVDYKDLLPPDQFEVFARLRAWRKTVAERDGLPLFAVLTNEQLAEIAKRGVASLAQLKAIPGVGEARAGKYGAELLAEFAKGKHAPGEGTV